MKFTVRIDGIGTASAANLLNDVLAAAIQSQTDTRTTLPANPAPPPIIAAVRTAPSS